jgi:AcrR family transcriptional regulator
MGTEVQGRAHPRRQERGKQRMESLLKAAEEVFAEVGFERATTNLIAARASVSPGTLYQFYPNKETMAESLAAQYAERLQALHAQAFDHRTRPQSLTALVDATVDPFLEFHRKAPAFDALFLVAAVSPELAGRVQLLHESVSARVTTLLEHRAPNATPDDVSWAGQGAVCVFRGMLPLVSSLKGSRRARAVRELKIILARYLQPLLGELPVPSSSSTRTMR